MNIPFVDVRRQYLALREEIDAAISQVIEKSQFIRGPEVEAFEREFAEKLGIDYCISCANGTDSLYIAMKGLGIELGDEVITTAHTWISSSETITQAGGRVVFCDTEKESFLMDLSALERLVTPKTKGIVVVHLAGNVLDMEAVMDFARRHKLWVVEDCAQAHLAMFDGKPVGTIGDVGTFSFYPGKNLGAMGDAGCIVTKRKDLAEWMQLFARHGGKGNHAIEGINSRMDGLQAAILRIKLPHLEEWNSMRKKIASHYHARLGELESIDCPAAKPSFDHVYHLYIVKVPNRDNLRQVLNQEGIQTGVNYPRALPFTKAYEYLGHGEHDFPNAFLNQSSILSLPVFPYMREEEVDFVCDALEKHLGK